MTNNPQCSAFDRDNNDADSEPNSNRTNGLSSNSSSNFSYYPVVRALQRLSFRSFQMLVFLWLRRKGFQDIQVLQRSSARGRRPTGGADFIATSPQFPFAKIAVQIRHAKTPVQRRAVDELWGFLLRHEMPHGLVITNARVSDCARAAAREFGGRPIRLLSASQLAGSVAALGLGTTFSGGATILTPRFLRSLDQLSFASTVKPNDDFKCRRRVRSALPHIRLNSALVFTRKRDLSWWLALFFCVVLLLIVATLGARP